MLREYQQQNANSIYNAWSEGYKNVLYVLPTGGGKTRVFSEILANHKGAACTIAHRQELIGQISTSLASLGVYHKIIGPRNLIKNIIEFQQQELGKSFYNPNANIGVAGVDTLIRRVENLKSWSNQVSLWVQDEAHHLLTINKWGKAVAMFPNAIGLGVSATPARADGRGLGRDTDGVFDTLVIGPAMRDLINQGFLTDYKIFAPPTDLDLTPVRTAADGDYNKNDLKMAVGKSRIVGDIVDHYIKYAAGKLGVTFATDVATATDIATQYNLKGVPAAVISANTGDRDRRNLLNKFRAREILQLVNVDLFGEGFDVPAIECCSFGRPTKSYTVYAQQFGRALRILPGKQFGIILDHVNNVARHGLPDAVKTWDLAPTPRAKRAERDRDFIPVTTCELCFSVYESVLKKCPYCNHIPIINGRASPEVVQGDLLELDGATLADMRGEIARIDGDPRIPTGLPAPAQKSLVNKWMDRQAVQKQLRDVIALWAGYRRAEGMEDSEIYRRFYFRYGVDIMTAQTFGKPEAEKLIIRIFDDIYC